MFTAYRYRADTKKILLCAMLLRSHLQTKIMNACCSFFANKALQQTANAAAEFGR